ncbi:hypothetical protein NMG60_11018518 [Bertholletia excelsa]
MIVQCHFLVTRGRLLKNFSPSHQFLSAPGMADDSKQTLIILLVAATTAIVVVAVYHFWTVWWFNRSSPNPRGFVSQQEEAPSSIENSLAEFIPAHKYQKDSSIIGEDNTCAICISEFQEGEELRTLPECLHSFHVPCIDMWFYSHQTCPICRACATASPSVSRGSPEDNLEASRQNRYTEPNLGLHLGVL